MYLIVLWQHECSPARYTLMLPHQPNLYYCKPTKYKYFSFNQALITFFLNHYTSTTKPNFSVFLIKNKFFIITNLVHVRNHNNG
jgi:hypothetical protein